MMDITLRDLAGKVGGTVVGDENVHITGLAGLNRAGPGDMCFLRSRASTDLLRETRAAAVVVAEHVDAPDVNLLKVADPEATFNRIAREFGPEPPPVPPGIHPTAIIDDTARLDPTCAIGPYTVVEAGAEIGPRTQIGAHGYIGHDVKVGADCRFFPRVVVREKTLVGNRVVLESGAVIGSDGFGFEPGPDGPRRIPQLGRVVLEDDVEIGANSTVDRARLDETRIGRGSKLDNLVQIGHNVELGVANMLAAQVGLAGTAKVGNGVVMGGQAGVSGHLTIGDGARLAARAGIMRSVDPGADMFGAPALPAGKQKRIFLLEQDLPNLYKRLKKLEQRIARIEEAH